jgi:hypothetical protein
MVPEQITVLCLDCHGVVLCKCVEGISAVYTVSETIIQKPWRKPLVALKVIFQVDTVSETSVPKMQHKPLAAIGLEYVRWSPTLNILSTREHQLNYTTFLWTRMKSCLILSGYVCIPQNWIFNAKHVFWSDQLEINHPVKWTLCWTFDTVFYSSQKILYIFFCNILTWNFLIIACPLCMPDRSSCSQKNPEE